MPENEFSNPLPPGAIMRQVSAEEDSGLTKLSNDDFRKLLMTPRATPGEAPPSKPAQQKPVVKEYNEEDDPRVRRRKKKSFYAKLKKQEMEREAELAEKYRDRAKERREGKTDYEETEIVSTTANYKAVAPNAPADSAASNRRKQLIEESKYLGGDMEHTHLVKGLDYALLHKVRAEINTKEREMEDTLETTYQSKSKDVDHEENIQFKSRMARNVYRIVFKTHQPQRNESFLPGRMAYQVDLDDEYAETDIPTTVMRSKADCPTVESQTTLTTNDIVINKLTQILSYLRQGQRGRKLKKKDKGKLKDDKLDKMHGADDSIFGELGGYMPSYTKPKEPVRSKEKERDRGRERERDRDRPRDYERPIERPRDYERPSERPRDYERPSERENERERERDRDRDRERDRDRDRDRQRGDRRDYRDSDRERRPRASYFEKPREADEDFDKAPSADKLLKSIAEKFGKPPPQEDESRFRAGWENGEKAQSSRDRGIALTGDGDRQKTRHSKKEEAALGFDSYLECYPGAMETADALDDSDDEVDYSKMDQGNKKGPVGRWDFDTAEEYSDYMNQKEALPKAAFQFGIKMSEGRKTRRAHTEKNEKAALDREWQKISQIIAKRKATGEGTRDVEYKRPKYM
ncbi:protein Red-like [Diadema antillarum]|uniref:protein Red-like n=1 Tax=Diadema antillarum TaxID=105358 RepID=UPI003A86B33C